MKTSSRFSILARAIAVAGVVLACDSAAQAASLITNGSFEIGSWGGAQSFVDPGNATDAPWSGLFDNWLTFGSTWVQDAVRADDGNRMVWVQPGNYLQQTLATSALQSGQTYTLSLGYDFFDPSDPNNLMGMDSSIQIYYVTGYYYAMPGHTMPMDDAPVQLYANTGMTDAWNEGANMDWQTANINFQLPSLAGKDYLRLYITAPSNSPGTPSMGVLIDNVSLNLAVIPEPGSLMLAVLGLMFYGRRRR